MNKEEFSQIQLVEAELHYHSDGSCGFQFSKPLPCTFAPISIKYEINFEYEDGEIGREDRTSEVILLSDRQQLFGRICPICNKYFRSTWSNKVYCPYCTCEGPAQNFLTPAQRIYIKKHLDNLYKALIEEKDFTVKIEEMVKDIPSNKHPNWIYFEERQQSTYRCINCKSAYDILAEYGGCPVCGFRNSLNVFDNKIEEARKKMDTLGYGDTLIKIIGIFEAYAKDIFILLKRKKDTKVNFQRIKEANEILKKEYDVNIFRNLDEATVSFVIKMFMQRHIFMHSAGRVDKDYINKSGDKNVRDGQLLRGDNNELNYFIETICNISKKLFQQIQGKK